MKTLSIFKDKNNYICVVETKEEYEFYLDYFRIYLDNGVNITELRDFDELKYLYDFVTLGNSSLALGNFFDMRRNILNKIAEVQILRGDNLTEKSLELVNDHRHKYPEMYL